MKRLLVFALAVGALAGCGGSSYSAPLALSWAFADGRVSCVEEAVAQVSVKAGDAALHLGPCREGLYPASVTLPAVGGGLRLTLTGTSFQDVPTYAGVVDLDPVLSPTTVTLYATAAR